MTGDMNGTEPPGNDRPARPEPADLDWAARVQRLEAEVAGLRRAMASRGPIEQAKGVLAERLRITPEEAFTHLSEISQHSNVRLADVASSVLASMTAPAGADPDDAVTAATDDDSAAAVTVSDAATAATGRAGHDGAPDQAIPVDFAPAYRRIAVTASTSADLAGLAAVLRDCGLDVDLVTLHTDGTEPRAISADPGVGDLDGAVAALTAAASAAIDAGRAVWRTPRAGLGRCVAYPLRDADGVVGAVAFGWQSAAPFTRAERAYLGALAPLAQRAAAGLWGGPAHPAAPLLDVGYDPALLLAPVCEGPAIVDFEIVYASREVPDIAGLSRVEQVGRRLLDIYPHLRPSGIFDAYCRVYETGEPLERDAAAETVVADGMPAVITVRRRAVRYADHVLATWHRDDDRIRRERQLRRMEALGHFGWADWDMVGRQSYWSPGMFGIFGRDQERGPVPFASLAGTADGADADAVRDMIGAVSRGKAAGAEFRLRRPDGERHVRIIAEPVAAADGRVTGAIAVAQDLTETRKADERMLRVQAQLAEQRLNLAAQRDLTRELRRVLYPGLVCDVQTPPARVVGRHVAPDDDRHLRGDFCDATLLDDGHILFAIGDSFGTDVRAGEVLARILYPARALGNSGASPATVLSILNADLNRDPVPPLASVVVARYCPVEDAVTWAQAGHLPPVRVRDRGTDMITRPAGTVLGLLPTTGYTQARLPLRDGDMIVWVTDGMLYDRSRPDVDPWPVLRRALAGARRTAGLDGILALCRTTSVGDEACMLVLAANGSGASGRVCASPGCSDQSLVGSVDSTGAEGVAGTAADGAAPGPAAGAGAAVEPAATASAGDPNTEMT